MKRLTIGNAAATLGLVLTLVITFSEAEARVVLAAHGPRYHRSPADHEIVLEGGLAEPVGDQRDGFFTTRNGFDSSSGYQLGARFRQYVGNSFAVSPAFHYTRFGSAVGLTDFGAQTNLAYDLRTSNYRYGLDFQAFVGEGSAPVRLFLTGGLALMHNCYRDVLEYNGTFEASANAPGFSAGLGLKLNNIELVAEYTYNRFETANFSADGASVSYNWDQLSVRVGLSFGR